MHVVFYDLPRSVSCVTAPKTFHVLDSCVATLADVMRL